MANDREYLDARFDGLEKLMLSETKNLKEYIGAVSANSKEFRHECEESVSAVEKELREHRESPEAHGAGVASRGKGEWLSIGAIFISLGALAVDFFKGKH